MKNRGKFTTTVALLMVFAVQVMAGEYRLDKSNSKVQWKGSKIAGEHYGTIELKSGNLQVENSKIASGTFEMDMTSIVNEDISNDAVNKKLVDHLKSDDFFSVDTYPVSKLVVREVKLKADNTYGFSGDLTIKGITHPVSFDAEIHFADGKVTAKGKMEVDRTLYNIRYGSGKFFQGLGDNLIADTFTLDFVVVTREVKGTAMK